MIKIPLKTAIWVLPVHLYALLVPLALIPVINKNKFLLEESIFNVELLFLAIGILIIGSLFEIIQNHIDHWYVTAETASGNGFSTIDGLFTYSILIGQALILVSLVGQNVWVKIIAIFFMIVTPILYIKRRYVFLPTSIIGTLNTVVAYFIFGNWVIFMQLIMVAFTVFFFEKLLKTNNQFYHGLTTLCASSGIWFLVIAINNPINLY